MSSQVFPALKFQVQEQIIDTKSLQDELNFYHSRQGTPSELTSKLTYILGDYNKSFPLSGMTVAGEQYGAKGTTREIDDVQFTYPVMGRDSKVATISETMYGAGDKPGIGNAPFFLIFPDNWLKRFYVIQNQYGTQAYIQTDGEPLPTGGFKYQCVLNPAGPSDYIDYTETAKGVNWVPIAAFVAESESRGTETNLIMPGKFKNQMNFIRTGMSWAGNIANKVMNIEITNSKGETTRAWMDWFMWQFEKNWLNDCEHMYWYSKYNRKTDGTIPLTDMLTGKSIPTGAGVIEQIGNKDTYSKLTYDILANKVGDALFGQSDSGDMSLTLMTGTGGFREFDRAMKEAGATLLGPFGAGDIASKFVTGTGRNLALGGFFDQFYHIDGYTIKVKKNPIFDIGRVANASMKHPESGLPLESYRMVFLDDSDVDGQPNIMHVAQKGRSFLDGVIPGLAPMPKSVQLLVNATGQQGTKFLTTDQDKSAYTRFKSAGIQILRANRCFDLTCTYGM
jgi:hypothetical protein